MKNEPKMSSWKIEIWTLISGTANDCAERKRQNNLVWTEFIVSSIAYVAPTGANGADWRMARKKKTGAKQSKWQIYSNVWSRTVKRRCSVRCAGCLAGTVNSRGNVARKSLRCSHLPEMCCTAPSLARLSSAHSQYRIQSEEIKCLNVIDFE